MFSVPFLLAAGSQCVLPAINEQTEESEKDSAHLQDILRSEDFASFSCKRHPIKLLVSGPRTRDLRSVPEPRLVLSRQIFSEPGDVSLQAIMNIARPGEQMKLLRIDDQLGGYSQAPQRLVHLLASDDGHVEIALPAHE